MTGSGEVRYVWCNGFLHFDKDCQEVFRFIKTVNTRGRPLMLVHVLENLNFGTFGNRLHGSRVGQRERAGPITQRSMDRNHPLLTNFFFFFTPHASTVKSQIFVRYPFCIFESTCIFVLSYFSFVERTSHGHSAIQLHLHFQETPSNTS